MNFYDFNEEIKDKSASMLCTWMDLVNDEFTLHLNCAGGFIVPGFALAQRIKSYPHKISCFVTCAASMATYIACCCAETVITDESMWLVHNPLTIVQGNCNDMEKARDDLDRMANIFAEMYAKKTGKTVDYMRDLMNKEIYLYGHEILDNGFADRMDRSTQWEKDVPVKANTIKKQALTAAVAAAVLGEPKQVDYPIGCTADDIAWYKKQGMTAADVRKYSRR